MTPLKYLMAELGLRSADWGSLSEQDKTDLKAWAAEEMRACGIEVK